MKKFSSFRYTYQRVLSGSLIFAVLFGISPTPLFTVANAAPIGTLSVVTQVINNQGGQNIPADFIINITGADATPSFSVGTVAPQLVNINLGTNYSVLVSPGSRYTASLSAGCAGVIATTTVVACEVTLNDSAVFSADTVAPNLIPNANLEIANGGDATAPQGWSRGWPWGTNVATYNYPVTVSTGSLVSSGKAMSITYASYTGSVLTGGDAKWYVQPVPVVPGHRYMYADSYSASTDTYIVAEFFDAANQHLSNAGYTIAPKTANNAWRMISASFIAPPGATSMAVYHQLNSVGTLVLDNVNLTEIELPTMFDRGFVTLAFDDGYISHFENAKPILNSAAQKGTFYAVSHTNGFGIVNSSLELADTANAGTPLGWFSSGGVDSTYTYPVAGRSGNAVRFSSPNPESGSGWNFSPVTVFANQNHQFGHFYKSTAESTVYIEATRNDGSLAYMQSDGGLVSPRVAYAVLPPAFDWTEYKSAGLWIPPEVKSVSVRYGLVASGTLDIDDANFGAYLDFMTPAQLLGLQSEQHEIGGHTETHANLTMLPFAEALKEINGSRTDLLSGGFTPMVSFAYPLGENNEEVQNALQSAGYTSGRGTIPGLNGKDANRFALASTMVMTATSMQEIQQMINEAVADRSWLILTFHHILPLGSPAATAYTTTPERLQSITNYLTQNNVPVRTIGAGVAMMDGIVTPPVVVPPTSTPTTTPPVITPTPTPPAPTPTTSPASGGGGGSSTFVYFGCTQQTALNYNRLANRDQGCLFASTPTPIGTSTLVGTSTTTSEMEGKNKKDKEDKDKKDKEDKKGEVLGAKTEKILRHNFKSNLRRGSKGNDVIQLQSYLKTNGHFTGPVTGYFGILTQGGVRNFQVKYKIDPIGIVGPRTRAALNNQDEVAFTIASTNANVGLILEKK